jgi:putative Mn2+ efflux pump MntP
MEPITILLIAIGLAMDAFAVSLASGGLPTVRTHRAGLRLAFHFGLFQAVMPVIGWFAGVRVSGPLTALDHWLAFLLLAVVGGRMIRSGLRPPQRAPGLDPSRGTTLVVLALATSIDALAVGLSLGMLEVSIWVPAAVIGLVTFALSWLGVRAGGRLGAAFGHRMSIVGGVILILIGLRILLAHLLA